jgi:GNAT superfamily N-acetyltransferase
MVKNEDIKALTRLGENLSVREARSDEDYHRAYPVIRQLIPGLDMQTYAQRVFVARATGYRMFMAESDGEVMGVIGIVPNHNLHDGYVTYIEHVVIDEKHRGHGYGTALIEFAEQRAREEGCKLIELDTDLGHDAAENLYRKSGYTYIGKYHQKELDRSGPTAAPLPIPAGTPLKGSAG